MTHGRGRIITARRALAAVLLAAGGAHAGEGRTLPVPMPPAYQQECAACHIAYPPRLLPAHSWQRLMNELPRHFGSDASLDPATLRQLSGWLAQHAARDGSAQPPPEDRITTSDWFVREHRKVPAAAWRRPSIRGASNCAACHGQAPQGVFDEHDVRIPR
jgi:hypothetical protein